MDTSNLYDLFLTSTGISTDTRKIEQGDLFFALRGDNFNGNEFAKKALDAGAKAVVIDDEKYQQPRAVMVEDSLIALQNLARFHRKQLSIPVIGLTGSNGKTTSKELLVAALSEKYKAGYTHGNLNNHIGVPLTLLNLPQDAEIAVIEMGANHQKEIEFLSEICQPDHGFITNYGKAHLEGFGGINGIIKGKSELYLNLKKNDKIAWYNVEDSIQEEKSRNIKRYSFGHSELADFPIFRSGSNHSRFVEVKFKGELISSQLTGEYNFGNIASAIALACHFGLTTSEIKKGIEGYKPTNNRSQIERTNRNTLLRDYYNANPSSMKAALENFNSIEGEGKWVVLGDMFELGEDAEIEHQHIADLATQGNFEEVILVGENFAKITTQAKQLKTTEEAVVLIKDLNLSQKFVLIKGSRGMQLEKVAAHL